ncbi:17235_t:CDS:2 [Entrophospora sp. SA101]|nr:17235_t:CDS:2 [Entrophospora sp. SA101]
MVNGGTFNTDLSPKQDQESDDDFQLVTPISQKRKKQLSLSKKDKKSNVLVKKAKTTNRNTDDDIDDPFISDNDLAESSEFLKDNSSSSNLDSISPDPKESKEIRKLTQIRPLLSIYILQSFTNIKIPVSFNNFEQFAKNMVDLMNFQVDMLSTIKVINKVVTRPNHIDTTLVEDTPEKKKNVENKPSSPKSPSGGGSFSPLI